MGGKAELHQIACATAKDWVAWLARHHAQSDGVWLVFERGAAKKGALSYAQAVEAALCYGWIDGQRQRIDASTWKQRYSPRRARSKWSKLNREKAQALIADKQMKPAGLRQVKRAKADGRWEGAYDAQSKAEAPADLLKALKKNKKATDFFATLDSRNRYAILHRIETVIKPLTRAKRIEMFVAMLSQRRKIYD